MEKRTIGIIQLIIGSILLIGTVISAFSEIDRTIVELYGNLEKISENTHDILTTKNLTDVETALLKNDHLQTAALGVGIYRTTLYTLVIGLIILFVFSIIFILQGLANFNEK